MHKKLPQVKQLGGGTGVGIALQTGAGQAQALAARPATRGIKPRREKKGGARGVQASIGGGGGGSDQTRQGGSTKKNRSGARGAKTVAQGHALARFGGGGQVGENSIRTRQNRGGWGGGSGQAGSV